MTGAQGLLKDGGTGRRAVLEHLAKGVGGTHESFYLAFGDTDAFVVVDLPDAATAAALSLTVGASGAATVLITPEEMDAATKKSVAYRPPGT